MVAPINEPIKVSSYLDVCRWMAKNGYDKTSTQEHFIHKDRGNKCAQVIHLPASGRYQITECVQV